AQLRQSNILQLADTLARYTKFLTNLFQGLRLSAVEPETLVDDLALPIVEYLKQVTDLIAQILVSEHLERRLRVLISDDLAKFGRIIVTDRCIERGWPN